MIVRSLVWKACFVSLFASLATSASAQSFGLNPTDIPQSNTDSENLDFADVDLDGDWDVAIANGGDVGPQQNELWINQGGLQGGTLGVFLDETAARLPQVADPSRDLEFADIDGDADHDLYLPANSQTINAPPMWWVNQGGDQGGTLGFYADETAARWVGLGGTGSSIAPSLVLPGGGFIDWTGDADFADLDNDGDLDLVHSSYGGAYGGTVPTRVFLNDGDGAFTEFNPSGFQLASSSINPGDPGLWCAGTFSPGTTDTTGAACDIAEAVVDFELGDTDGDFDIDIVLVGRQEVVPRFFRNRLEIGALAFSDESALAFPGVALGAASYDQELGDLDGDGDLDLYGLNWSTAGFSFNDVTLENVGGVFVNLTVLTGSGADEEEGDFLDYDNDGDLDLYVANFSGQDKLYQNQGGSPITYVDVSAAELPPGLGNIGRDVQVADVNADGDYDVFVANAAPGTNYYVENLTQVADTTAPTIPLVESVTVPVAGAGSVAVRAHVVDNTPLYTTWYYPVQLEVDVAGIDLPPIPMTASRGAVFRGELPANLVGAVNYRIRATDLWGNSSVSAPVGYAAAGSSGAIFGVESPATGASAPTLQALSEPRGDSTLYLAGQGLPAAPAFLGVSLTPLIPALIVPGVPNLALNIAPPLVALASGVTDASGTLVFDAAVPTGIAGAVLHAQFLDVAFDGTFGSSKGLSLTVL